MTFAFFLFPLMAPVIVRSFCSAFDFRRAMLGVWVFWQRWQMECALIGSHGSPHDETPAEEDHREAMERLHAPELERERPWRRPGSKTSSKQKPALS